MNYNLFIKSIRGIIKRNKTVFSIHRHLTDKDYQRERKNMQICTIKNREQIHQEMNAYADYWGCPPDDYVRYGLFNKHLSLEEILDYVPMQYYYCQFQDQMYEGVDNKPSVDKLYEYNLFKKKGIPQPEVLGKIHKNRLYSLDDAELTYTELVEQVKEGERLFIKPIDGNCGTGIVVVNKREGALYLKGVKIHDLNELPLNESIVYIIQKGLVQRSDFADFNSSSLNTLRTIVKYDNGEARVVAVLLRIGRKGSDVDNSGQGGISVEVNLKDGALGEYAGREHGGCMFSKHPDNGFVFKGAKIRDWEEVMKQIKEIVSRITDYKTIGWDIAVCEDKVYAIEMNLGWGIEHAQTIAGGFRRRFGIYPK